MLTIRTLKPAWPNYRSNYLIINTLLLIENRECTTPKPAAYTSAKLISPDKAMILELANRTRLYAGVVDFYIFRLEEANLHAVNLIKTLKKAYNLEDE